VWDRVGISKIRS
jgi:hypothetical protein